MELDKDKFKQLATKIIQTLKDLETERLALRAALYAVKATFRIDGDPEELVAAGMKSPQLQTMMRDKYDVPLERFLQRFDKEAGLGDLMLEYLRAWKPSTQPN